MHVINSFNDPSDDPFTVTFDTCAMHSDFPDDLFTKGYKLEPFPQENLGMIYKRCKLSKTSCSCFDILNLPFELPVINPMYRMKPHRYVYATATDTSIAS